MKFFIIAITALFLAGCGSTKIEYVPVPYFVDVVCPELGKTEGIRPLPVVWVSAVDREGNQVLGLRGDMYSNLSINSADTLRYIRQQNSAIDYYKTCIENHNSLQNEKGEPQ